MVPIMGSRFTAVLISLMVFTCQWLMPAPAPAAMDVAKQVLIGADYSNKDLRGATFDRFGWVVFPGPGWLRAGAARAGVVSLLLNGDG